MTVTRRPSGFQGWVGRAASLAVAFLAVLTLVASGASHDLLHADDRDGAVIEAAAATAAPPKAGPAAKTAVPRQAPVHGCSGHCGAHAAHQAPMPLLVSAPFESHDGWRLEADAALRQRPTTGPERPPRA